MAASRSLRRIGAPRTTVSGQSAGDKPDVAAPAPKGHAARVSACPNSRGQGMRLAPARASRITPGILS